jgi:hypothetical protein
MLTRPHSLTVAGAAQALCFRTRTCFPFNRGRESAWRRLALLLPPTKGGENENYSKSLSGSPHEAHRNKQFTFKNKAYPLT